MAEHNLVDLPNTKKTRRSLTRQQIQKTIQGEIIQGRPSIYNQELADTICGLLAEGMSLNRITKREGMPQMSTIFRWLSDERYVYFRENYTRAKMESADALFEGILENIEEVHDGTLDPFAGRVVIDAKRWAASKLKPKVYGDKVDLTTNGKDLPAPMFGGLSLKKPEQTS